MKKVCLILIFFAISVILTGCSSTRANPLKGYEGKTSAEIYYQGETALQKKHYSKATEAFGALEALYPFGPYSQQAELNIIYAFYMNNDPASALAAADRYIRLYPQDINIDYVYYIKGLISIEQNSVWYQRFLGFDPAPYDLSSSRDAYTAFSQVTTQYPHSVYAPSARMYMSYIRNVMARKEVDLADFYMIRKAYVAAINRASEVVQHYSGSTSVPHALEILALAYKAEGLNDLADKSYATLQMSYPDSLEFKRLVRTYNKFP